MKRAMFDIRVCIKALKLSKTIEGGKDLAKALKVPYAADARRLAALGARHEEMFAATLTPPERMLILELYNEHMGLLERGEIRSPELKHVSYRCRKSRGWAYNLASKRLDTHRRGEVGTVGTGLGFVTLSGNGYANLTPAGIAMVRALIDERQKTLAARNVAVGTPEVSD